jgi:hypothetical protein
MQLSAFRSATLAATALFICASVQAQWPARWNSSGTANDEGQCVAIDHRGNVFLCGKSTHLSRSDWDFQVLKYNASGTLLWAAHYDGAANGDDIATSIAVDWEGNCYVAGVSDGGSDNDFTVIKYDPDGFTVWPGSGSRTG